MASCGFDSLPNQIATRRALHGISFNLLVVGDTGIGKTTLINNLFKFDYGDSPDVERQIPDVSLRIKEYWPQNKYIKIRFTVAEAKGFNNQEDISENFLPIVKYIDARHDDFLNDELQTQERRYNDLADNRIHCCIYMIPWSFNHRLRPIDLLVMKQLHQRVCLIPVLAKSDVLDKQERQAFKESLRHQISLHNIEIYNTKDFQLPLAVAAGNVAVPNGQAKIRQSQAGDLHVEDFSDFPVLSALIFKSDMLQLVDYTNQVHYENFRKEATSGEEFQEIQRKYETEREALLKDIEGLEQLQVKD